MPFPALRFRVDRLAGSTDYQVELFVDATSAATTVFTEEDLQNAPAGIQLEMIPRPDAATVAGVGRHLHSLLVRGDVAAAMPGGNLQSITVDAVPENLRMLPWEMLYDGRNFLTATNRALPAWRTVPGHAQHPGDPLPLRVLVVVGDRDERADYWADELRAIRRIFRRHAHRIDWELLIRPTRERLSFLCRTFRPHVFHFIGHGRMTPGRHAEPVLVIATDDPKVDLEISVSGLEELLASAVWKVRMALVNACRSAQASSQQACYDFGRSFIEVLGGCCAIVMQGDIEVSAAATFASEVYEKLVGGKQIDVAVAEARRTLRQKNPNEPDWTFPVLQIGCDVTSAVPMKFAAPAAAVSSIAIDFEPIRQFVDRQDERRLLWSEVAYGETPHQLLIVHGEEKTGKTWLLEWLVRNWALLGERVRYLNFGKDSHDYHDVLERIRKGTGAPWGANQPFAAAAFRDYNSALADIQSGQPKVDQYIPDLFEKFIAALDAVAADPLLLVLDSFVSRPAGTPGGIVESGFNYLVQHFVKRIADGELPNVRLLLGTGKEEVQTGLLAGLMDFSSSRVVGRLPADQFIKWAHERFADVIRPDFVKVMEAIIATHKEGLTSTDWTMGELDVIATYLQPLPRREP
jgi:hypothetical protein